MVGDGTTAMGTASNTSAHHVAMVCHTPMPKQCVTAIEQERAVTRLNSWAHVTCSNREQEEG